jgi:quercetin dioxygenase-like cupin family protein
MSVQCKVIKHNEFRWEGVQQRDYKAIGDGSRGVTRQTLMGEGPGEGDLAFITRYFEIEPGGFSSLERHQHPHAVVILRGEGKACLEDEVHSVRPFDCVYVAPGASHQFRATSGEPLGFLCVVDRVRDRPQPADQG